MTHRPLPREISNALEAGLVHVLADAHRVISGGRFEQPHLFATIIPDDVFRLARRIARWCAVRPLSENAPLDYPSMDDRDAAIARQVLQCLADWPESRREAAAAWELALSALLMQSPAMRRRA